MMVNKLILAGHALSSVRQIRYFLAQFGLFLRQSQLLTSAKSSVPQLEFSLRYSKEALNLAVQCHFGEIVSYCRQQIACLTEIIVRERLRNLKAKPRM